MPALTFDDVANRISGKLTIDDLPTEAARKTWVEETAMDILQTHYPRLAAGSLSASEETRLRIEADLVVDLLNIATHRVRNMAKGQ